MINFQVGALWENQHNLCKDLQYTHCIGIDEAGRGALAGPVMAAAVCFDPDTQAFFLDDSKKLSPKKREEIFHLINRQKVYLGLGISSNALIDQKNILQATKLAMIEAYKNCLSQILKDIPNPRLLVMIDGNINLRLGPEALSLTIVKGDATLASIAAASIIAKVSRDHRMTQLHHDFPNYGFAQHKGYGTSQHFQAIHQLGISCHHRTSFLTRSLNDHH
jgi:ribonuclease HII